MLSITLDAGDADIVLKDDGTQYAHLQIHQVI